MGNVTKTSERFGDCEWLTAADADGFLDQSTLQVQRTGASCMMFDREANTMAVAVITMSHDTAVSLMKRAGPCQHVTIPEFGGEAFREHSCTKATATPSTSSPGRTAGRHRSCSHRSSRIRSPARSNA